MKIVVVCEQGNNRSVHFAHLLKYWNNDVLTGGLKTNSEETLKMLYEWAETIILTEKIQENKIPEKYQDKVVVFEVGPDTYHRPFNAELNLKVRKFLDDNKEWLKNAV